jgi:hypothetical protein
VNFDEFLQPAIFALTGKPGAGKSYFSTRVIIAEILKGNNRTIVTNVPINRKKLAEYVKKDFYIYDLETFCDNKMFFTNRGSYKLEIENSDANIDFKNHLQEDDDGVLYIIDEAHLYFNSRKWKDMSQATLCYITFIRHVGDTLIWMSQKFSDIDAQFRGKTQAFHLLRNLSKEKIGIFKRGEGFRCYQYQQESDIGAHGSVTSTASQDFTFPFNIKVAECYNTSLFNKAHDKKYRIKGIPINYVVYAGFVLLIGFIVWGYNGGYRQLIGFLTPDMAQTQLTSVVSKENANIAPLPPSDPLNSNFKQPSLASSEFYEVPKYLFSNSDSGYESETHKEFTELEYNRSKEYWFGKTIKAKITFFSEGNNKDAKKSFDFAFQWSNYLSFSQLTGSKADGLYALQTPFFNGFVTWVDANGIASNLKETEILLKENVPFTLNHGYQLPTNNTFASQGVIRQQRSYQQIGFQLTLILECLDGRDLLKVDVENSDVMDLSADQPILQTFSASNIIDVNEQTTYLIADFNSQSAQKSKGFLRSTDYESNLNNKIFLSYGND